MKTRQDYKNAALARLSGFWGAAVLATFIYLLLGSSSALAGHGSAMMASSVIFTIFISWPVIIGYFNSVKEFQNGGSSEMAANIFRIGFTDYFHKIATEFLKNLFILLWTILLIIPGIIMSYAYMLTEYIMVDRPELSPIETLRESKRLMRGHKWELFVLHLSFIGWGLLTICTFGIGLLWLIPYITSTQAQFYKDILAEDAARGAESAQSL